MRIATYNVENLFRRMKVLNLDTTAALLFMPAHKLRSRAAAPRDRSNQIR
jgi:hypothetical protein